MTLLGPFLFLLLSAAPALLSAAKPGSVVFIHPDGTGLGHWNAGRLLAAGPDGDLNWDRMERLAAYRVHQKDWLATSSHAGATVHAYGKKVATDSYGMDRDQPLTAASGRDQSIMREAMEAGVRCGIVNSGHIAEPGTGVFLASSPTRQDKTGIAAKIVRGGADVIFCGGERFLLPEGEKGAHGVGVRTDGVNLLEEARGEGYMVIFTREELLSLPSEVERVLGIFADTDTYNSMPEARLAEAGLETYDPAAPTFAEMTAAALRILGNDPERRFFLVAEEEGTDNFSNANNAKGMLDAVLRADAAIGEVLAFAEARPERNLLVLVGADSDAGHPTIWSPYGYKPDAPLPPQTGTGADLDGVGGAGTAPFVTKPDAFGNRHAFGIAWPTSYDFQGSTVTRAHGYRADLLPSTLDNTGIYRILYQVLFGDE